jgi:hypothetical protein
MLKVSFVVSVQHEHSVRLRFLFAHRHTTDSLSFITHEAYEPGSFQAQLSFIYQSISNTKPDLVYYMLMCSFFE